MCPRWILTGGFFCIKNLINKYTLTYSSPCSFEPPSANCLFVFCYFSFSSYGTFNYYFSSPSVFVLFFYFFFLFSFYYSPSTSLTTPTILSISQHFQIRVCVGAWCGLLFLAARGNVRRHIAIEQKCFNGVGLSDLSLKGCFERSKISLGVVQARLKQSRSKCSYTVRSNLPSVLVWWRCTVWSYRIDLLFAEVVV